jgi:hypothetical protein
LTQGNVSELSAPVAAPVSEPSAGSASSGAAVDPTSFVRVVAYLTPEEMQKLDSAWIQLRGKGVAANKADIMRAALMLTVADTDALADFLKPPAPAAKTSGSRRRAA